MDRHSKPLPATPPSSDDEASPEMLGLSSPGPSTSLARRSEAKELYAMIKASVSLVSEMGNIAVAMQRLRTLHEMDPSDGVLEMYVQTALTEAERVLSSMPDEPPPQPEELEEHPSSGAVVPPADQMIESGSSGAAAPPLRNRLLTVSKYDRLAAWKQEKRESDVTAVHNGLLSLRKDLKSWTEESALDYVQTMEQKLDNIAEEDQTGVLRLRIQKVKELAQDTRRGIKEFHSKWTMSLPPDFHAASTTQAPTLPARTKSPPPLRKSLSSIGGLVKPRTPESVKDPKPLRNSMFAPKSPREATRESRQSLRESGGGESGLAATLGRSMDNLAGALRKSPLLGRASDRSAAKPTARSSGLEISGVIRVKRADTAQKEEHLKILKQIAEEQIVDDAQTVEVDFAVPYDE